MRQLVGDCRVTLPTLEAGSNQSCITSPPYFGLRDYGTPPLVWGGVAEHAHEWMTIVKQASNGNWDTHMDQSRTMNPASATRGPQPSNVCACGAWLGSLGLEPTPDLYVEHIVECFRHVRRVLRDDGTLWVNLGDSYAGSGKGPSNSLQAEASQLNKGFKNDGFNERWGNRGGQRKQEIGRRNESQFANGQAPTQWIPTAPGLKPKDLMMMPFRVAMALQADGWYLRSCIPWLKRNSMPESVRDRPATSVEYVFLLSKSARYFWDADAVRVPSDPNRKLFTPGTKQEAVNDATGRAVRNDGLARLGQRMNDGLATGRNRRNSDWFFESWQGLMLDEHDDPLALVVNPQPFSGAHFATFPPKLVEPMVKASTRPGDTVLDLFSGAGTVGLVADRLGRNAVLCELKDDYADMSSGRIVGDAPMFAEVAD